MWSATTRDRLLSRRFPLAPIFLKSAGSQGQPFGDEPCREIFAGMAARGQPALVLVDGVNLALSRLRSYALGHNTGDKSSTAAQLFWPALTSLRHLRRVDVSQADHDACNLEGVTVHRPYATADRFRSR
jgi:hypothetical protein